VPSFTLSDIQQAGGPDAQLLHAGEAGIAWHDRDVRAAVTEDLTYGQFNSQNVALATTVGAPNATTPTGAMGPTPLQPVAANQTITLLTTRTAAAVSVRAGRRASFSVDGGYTVGGGLDAFSQLVLPREYGPSADASFSYDLSRRDQAVTVAHAWATHFENAICRVLTPQGLTLTPPCSPDDQLVAIAQGIRHALRPATGVELSAGVAVTQMRLDAKSVYHAAWYPTAEASLSHRFGERGRSTLQLGAQLEPAVDQLAGVITDRLQGEASFADVLNEVTTVRASAFALQTVPTTDPYAETMVSGEVGALFRVNRRLHVGIGERGVWQREDRVGTFFSLLTYIDLTVEAPTLRF
jgi:hypothetical protein